MKSKYKQAPQRVIDDLEKYIIKYNIGDKGESFYFNVEGICVSYFVNKNLIFPDEYRVRVIIWASS